GGVAPGATHLEYSRFAIEAWLDPPHELVARKDRQDVVAVLAFGRRDVHLEAVAEAEQRLRPVAIVDQSVERRQEGHPVGDRLGADLGMRVPLALLEPDAEGAEPLL